MSKQASTSLSTEQKSQYHHFIPRFILKSFAHSYRPKNPKGFRPSKNGPRRGEQMLYTIDLAGSGDVDESPVAKSFGMTDMYRDIHTAGDQHALEKKLANLESTAGNIIADIRKKHQENSAEVWMTRRQRNTLRKFLFIMKYRSAGFHTRFNHQSAEEYSADDRDFMLEYMRKRGFTRPMDVWFDNIEAILSLNMDSDEDWPAKLHERMYPPDAVWAFAYIQAMYMAMCTPAHQSDEFVLSGNLFGVFEGPNSFEIDTISGEEVGGAYTEYHTFAAITPQLMIVLRSTMLPNAQEDIDEVSKGERELHYNLNREQHPDPASAISRLEDLPVHKALNSYTKIVNGRRQYKGAGKFKPRPEDRFGFPFFPIETRHVDLINAVMFEQAGLALKLGFHSKGAMQKTLKWYLTSKATNSGMFAFKKFEDELDPRFAVFKKLEKVAEFLGATVTGVYDLQDPEIGRMRRDLRAFQSMIEERFEQAASVEGFPMLKWYSVLGGTGKTLQYDLDQAARMLKLRIKIDVWSQGLRESARHQIRLDLLELYCQLLPRRIYLYVKRIRTMCLKDQLTGMGKEGEDAAMTMMLKGAEDTIAQASSVFRKSRLSQIMLDVVSNELDIITSLGFKVAAELPVEVRIKSLPGELQAMVFIRAGSICTCGIEILEERARNVKSMIESSRGRRNPAISDELVTEQKTRALVRADFEILMIGKLPKPEIEHLRKVLFGVLYTCPLDIEPGHESALEDTFDDRVEGEDELYCLE